MRSIVPRARGRRKRMLWIAGAMVVLAGIVAVRMLVTLYQVPFPSAILILGGDSARVKFAVGLIRENPGLKVWMSDFRGAYSENSAIFQGAGIAPERVRYDFCATDTVTNFTCNVGDFTREGIRHVYVVTSDYHMARARAIAGIVLGSRGIVITPVPVDSSGGSPESSLKIVRDSIRSLLWIVSGKSGASLNPRLKALSI